MLFCNTPVQEVGTLKEGSMPILFYVVENQSDETYNLTPWSSCGCSTPILTSGTVNPREKFIIRLQFDTMGKVGMNEKSFGVWYGDKQKLNLKFKVEVVK